MGEHSYDLVILGSGSTAFAAALRAQELGKTGVMTEERTVGGTCVNRGCLPSKNLIEAAIPTSLPHRSAAQGATRRTLLMWLGGFGLLLAACASPSRPSDRYVVLESQKFT